MRKFAWLWILVQSSAWAAPCEYIKVADIMPAMAAPDGCGAGVKICYGMVRCGTGSGANVRYVGCPAKKDSQGDYCPLADECLVETEKAQVGQASHSAPGK